MNEALLAAEVLFFQELAISRTIWDWYFSKFTFSEGKGEFRTGNNIEMIHASEWNTGLILFYSILFYFIL